MKSFTLPVIAIGFVAAAVGLAGAANAAAGDANASRTINQLEAQGFRVIINKAGAAPLEQCTVSNVRRQIYTRMDTGAPGAMDDIVTTVTARTVYVDVTC